MRKDVLFLLTGLNTIRNGCFCLKPMWRNRLSTHRVTRQTLRLQLSLRPLTRLAQAIQAPEPDDARVAAKDAFK